MTRVVITGIGAVSPLGNDVPSTWQAIRRRWEGGHHYFVTNARGDEVVEGWVLEAVTGPMGGGGGLEAEACRLSDLLPGWTRATLGMVETTAGPALLLDPAELVAGPSRKAAA